MRSFDEADESDREEATRLGAKPWMLAALKFNPDYVCWGPHEDYMWTRKGKDGGWNSEVIVATWPEFEWKLDELNECVNFYFSIGRDQDDCKTCGGNGYHPDAQWVTESFYEHVSPFTRPTPRMAEIMEGMNRAFGSGFKTPLHGNDSFPSEETLAKYKPEFRAFCESMRIHGSWGNRITQDEVDALQASHRVGSKWNAGTKSYDLTPITAAEINDAQRGGGLNSHDAINRSILCRTRCERFGIPVTCETCDGHGSVFTAPEAHVSLTLWWLHPRKGASRGIEITKLREEEIGAACAFLRDAAKRNADRFARLPKTKKGAK